MSISPFLKWLKFKGPRVGSLLLVFILVSCLSAPLVLAQRKFSKSYPARKDVRIELKNISGRITVESWDRDSIKLSANFESSGINFAPRQTENGLVIDIMGDNRGRGDVGDVNFTLYVPVNSSVDLETRRGDIKVSNIRSTLVRAHVSTEGDITLTNISAKQVFAQNLIGFIFFDGDFWSGGTYEFKSGQGDISIRIPADSAFSLVATAPARKISLGQFWNDAFKSLGNGRKYVGDVGDGRATVMVTNFRGGIQFLRR